MVLFPQTEYFALRGCGSCSPGSTSMEGTVEKMKPLAKNQVFSFTLGYQVVKIACTVGMHTLDIYNTTDFERCQTSVAQSVPLDPFDETSAVQWYRWRCNADKNHIFAYSLSLLLFLVNLWRICPITDYVRLF